MKELSDSMTVQRGRILQQVYDRAEFDLRFHVMNAKPTFLIIEWSMERRTWKEKILSKLAERYEFKQCDVFKIISRTFYVGIIFLLI